MTLEREAVFLAGFLLGTYDLKGEQEPPAVLKPFLDRVLNGTATPLAPIPQQDLHPAETSALITSTTPEPDLPELTRKMLADKANQSAPPAARAKQPDWEKPGEVIMGRPARNPSLRGGSSRIGVSAAIPGLLTWKRSARWWPMA